MRKLLINNLAVVFFLTLFMSSCKDEEKKLIEKAERLHQEILTIDSHVDTPLMFAREEFDIGKRNEIGRLDFPRMQEGGLDAAFFAVFIGQGIRTDEAYETAKRRALEIIYNIHELIDENSDVAGLALTPNDAYRLKEDGKRAVYIGIENGYPIGHDLNMIDTFYDLGARYLGLCHSYNNHICDSSSDREGEEHGGLSDFGKDVVKKLNRIGMMIDVSHMSDKAFYDVLEVTQAPIVASHSNARAVCDHHRNLDNNMLKALAENEGVIQLCLLTVYVKETAPNPQRDSAITALREKYNDYMDLSDEEVKAVRLAWAEINEKFPRELALVSDLIDHVDHIVNLIGIDYVGIGSDFDGGGQLKDCKDVSEMKIITLELLRRGYSKEDIEKIWGGNFMRVFREVEKVAEELKVEPIKS